MQNCSILPEVFRAYDIRGQVGSGFDADSFYTIGQALAVQLVTRGRSHCFLARDARLTSEVLTEALSQGLIDSGIHVVHLGAVPTPVLYYATLLTFDSGFMVTGSHNPADYNGIKMVLAGKTLIAGDISELYDIICRADFLKGQGSADFYEIENNYVSRITSDIVLERSLKVVVDCGNGIAGRLAPQVLKAIGCEVIPLYCEVDGRFPNHHPDPTVPSNLLDLQATVLKTNAHLGLAFDGDADRLGVVTGSGEIIWPDRLLMFYAKHLLQTHPGATIVYDVKCSKHLKTFVLENGGVPFMCPTGHSIVKSVMKEKSALLAGEMSGHLFFKERWYGFDDAIYSACRLLEWLSQYIASVDEVFSVIPKSVSTPEIKIAVDEALKFSYMASFCRDARFPNNADIIRIDGIRVEFEGGFGLLRASNTTPCLILRFEGEDEERLREIQAIFRQELARILPMVTLPF